MTGYGYFFCLLFFNALNYCVFGEDHNDDETTTARAITLQTFMFWPEGLVPFYIKPDNFDPDQTMEILKVLQTFSFMTCLKFQPIFFEPQGTDHVLVFQNPKAIKKCTLDIHPHSIESPHNVTVGYDCMQPAQIEMVVMRALGFPFEHNRQIRDKYIEVRPENVEPGYIELFTKDVQWPKELTNLPYDTSSVLHFGEREFSKNGHRTIVFKKGTPQRTGLTSYDLKKIRIVYEKECHQRDLQEKLEKCKNIPSIRAKRGAAINSQSLRVNRNIAPPPKINNTDDKPAGKIESDNKKVDKEKSAQNETAVRTEADKAEIAKDDKDIKTEGNSAVFRADNKDATQDDESIKELGIDAEIDELVTQLHKIGAAALKTTRSKLCVEKKPLSKKILRATERDDQKQSLLNIIHDTVNYAWELVSKASANTTVFCEDSNPLDLYQRTCPFFDSPKCRQTYRSTKSGPVKYSTQHRPIPVASTKHQVFTRKNIYHRSGIDAENAPLDNTDNTTPSEAMVKRIRRDLKSILITSLQKSDGKNAPVGVKRFEQQKFRYKRTVSEHNRTAYEKNWDSSKVSIEGKVTRPQARRGDEPEQMDYQNYEGGKKRRKKPHKKPRPAGLRTIPLTKDNIEFYSERKWPDNVVRYYIKENGDFNADDVRRRLAEVNEILRKNTCVRIQEIKESDMDNYEDFLVLDNSPDYITGRVGGKQNFGVVELLKGGQHRQHAAMVVMAMLGFYFEVSRHDRDQYIRVHNRHVRPDKLHHFEKIREDATLDLPYDYKSATHPAWQFWRQVGRTGISTVATFKETDPDGAIMKSLGQNSDLLSELDLVKINSVYGTKCFKDNSAEEDKEDVQKEKVEGQKETEEQSDKEEDKKVSPKHKKSKKEKKEHKTSEGDDKEEEDDNEGKNSKKVKKEIKNDKKGTTEKKEKRKWKRQGKDSEKNAASSDENKNNNKKEKKDENNVSENKEEKEDEKSSSEKEDVKGKVDKDWNREEKSSVEKKENSKDGSEFVNDNSDDKDEK